VYFHASAGPWASQVESELHLLCIAAKQIFKKMHIIQIVMQECKQNEYIGHTDFLALHIILTFAKNLHYQGGNFKQKLCCVQRLKIFKTDGFHTELQQILIQI
jgi:hypothetical protein